MRMILFLIAGIIATSMLVSVGYSDNHVVVKGNSPIFTTNSDSGRFDFNHDDKADYYVKAHYTGNENQKLRVDYKIQDECVDQGPKDAPDVGGDTYDDAVMKIAFTTKTGRNIDWTIDDVTVTNPWFNSKHNDDNKQIDLVTYPAGTYPRTIAPTGNGDDVIQGIGKKGAFKHHDSIPELHGQSGWTGSIFVDAPPGNYKLWTLHPNDGSNTGCDILTGFRIPIIID